MTDTFEGQCRGHLSMTVDREGKRFKELTREILQA